MDMGAEGPKFTWSNGRKGMALVRKRLDRALCDSDWSSLFPEGRVKLNVDGCWYDADVVNRTGFGGLFRDSVGAWILGFYGKCNTPTCHEAELRAIYEGLNIIMEKGIAYVELESDSLWAVNSINGEVQPQMCTIIVEDIKTLVRMTGTTIRHASRQANQCANGLARLGAVQDENLVLTAAIIPLVREDILGGRNLLD